MAKMRANVLNTSVDVAKSVLTRFKSLITSLFGFDGKQIFTCVLCGHRSGCKSVGRESMPCDWCGSTWRARAMVLGLLQAFGMPNVTLSQVNEDWSTRGIGISDDIKVASRLGGKFSYVNTYYHQGPKLDLCSVDQQWVESARFVICSDVLEHVPAPVEMALKGLYSLLQSGGVAVISVPYKSEGATEEFYPELDRYEVVDDNVVWYDTSGVRHVDVQPEFHGGAGQTLAFRLWSLPGLLDALSSCGFSRVSIMTCDEKLGVPAFGRGDAILLAVK